MQIAVFPMIRLMTEKAVGQIKAIMIFGLCRWGLTPWLESHLT